MQPPALHAHPAPLPELRLWQDPLPRSGYANMAADELLSRTPHAWLRVYAWAEPSVSYGYFDTARVAASIFPGEGVRYIRRWTGGGIVDHRSGHTYTLTLPAPSAAAAPWPPASVLYAWIHGALAAALCRSGVPCSLLTADAPDGGRACWASPVTSDIVDPAGCKLAGAGQRRYRGAVLHQGLVQQCEPAPGWVQLLAAGLAERVVEEAGEEPYPGFARELDELCRSKYLAPAWEDESHGRRAVSPLS